MANWKLLKSIVLIGVICLFGCTSRDSTIDSGEENLPELSFASDLQTAIDGVLSAYPECRLGISAAVKMPEHQTWSGVSGYSHQDVPISQDMLFIVGSIQKNFEAALVLKLAEDDLLSLDDPISNYLPPYPNVDGNITIRQLLNHTSGVFNVFEHPDFPWVGTDVDYSKEWEEEEVFNTFVLEPYGPPGYAQHYSSTNYLLITLVIEEVTGSTVPEEIECHFLEPMGLENTYVSMGELPPARYPRAHPWADIDLDGNLDDLHDIPRTWSASLSHPVMFSTPRDLVDWLNALYHDRNVLDPNSLEKMLTYPEVTLHDPEGGKYALGVVDYTHVNRTQAFGHMGSALGYTGAALYLPDYNLSIAWLINTGESPPWLAGYMMFDTWSAISKVIRTHAKASP
jgi:D-alanyl-D-alanine carboxypeptidase